MPVSEKAWKAPGSRMFIEPNRPVTVEELLRGMIVQSGNDACIALAEAVAGSEEDFVATMNREAQRLGLKNTQLRERHRPARPAALHHGARPRRCWPRPSSATSPSTTRSTPPRNTPTTSITQPNRNRLLWLDPTVDGVKTGHTEIGRLLPDRLRPSAARAG